MHKFARFLLLWIIAIALPIPGAFAGSLPHGLGGDHPVADEQASAHLHDLDADRHDDLPARHSHAEMLVHLDHSARGHSHHGSGLEGSCSACAACCATAAPPPTAVAMVAVDAKHAVPSFVFFAVVTFVTDGPERPPRRTLA